MTDSNIIFAFKPPIYIADEQSHKDAISIITAEPWDRPRALQSFNQENRDYFELMSVHTNENPVLFMGRYSVFMWVDSDQNNWVETASGSKIPDFNEAISVLCDIKFDNAGKIKSQIPLSVVVGDNFQGVLEYRSSCCGGDQTGFNAMVFVNNNDGIMTYHTLDALTTKDDIKQYFEKLLDNDKQEQGIFRSSEMMAMIYAQHVGLDVRMQACPQNVFKSIPKAELKV